jgi:hypothetical protein
VANYFLKREKFEIIFEIMPNLQFMNAIFVENVLNQNLYWQVIELCTGANALNAKNVASHLK